MNVCILGGNGYLGSKVTIRLVELGFNVFCLKRASSDISRLEQVANKIEFCNIDEFLESKSSKYHFEAFVNFACKYPRNSYDDFDTFNSNFITPMQVYLFLLKCQLKRVLSINTSLPQNFNAYSKSKSLFSDFVRWHSNYNGNDIKFCDILMENFYGEDEPTDRFIPGTVYKLKRNETVLLTDGLQIRDFIYISDAVNAIVSLFLNNDLPNYLSVPVGSGVGVSVKDFITYLHRILGSSSNLCFGAIQRRTNEPDTVADLTVLKKYGICPSVHWKDGLKKYL